MESREEEADKDSSPLTDSTDTNIQHIDPGTEAAKETTSLVTTSDHHTDEDETVELVKGNSVAEETTGGDSADETVELVKGNSVAEETTGGDSADETVELVKGNSVTEATTDEHGTVKLVKGNSETDGETEGEEEKGAGDEVFVLTPTNETSGDGEDIFVFEQKSSTPTDDRPAPPSSLDLDLTSLPVSAPKPTKKKVLLAPAISLSLDRRESILSADSEDFPSAFLSPSLDDDDDDDVTDFDFDLDTMATPSDTESLHFPYDLELEADLRRLGVATPGRPVIRPSNPRAGSNPLNPNPHANPWSSPLNPNPHANPWSSPNSPTNPLNPNPRPGSRGGTEPTGLDLQTEDMVDGQGTRWRCFSTGDPPQDSTVNMSVLEPFLQVLSHGGYYGDSMNDIIVFSSCYLPQNSLENYQYVMDNLFRYVVGTLELMVAENYVIVYFCAGGQKDKLPGIGWLRECYTTIDRRLRKNLKGFFVVHPTWSIKALITIIKPFISSKFSRKLQFVASLQSLSLFVPTEHVQIPHTVSLYDQNLTR